MKMYGYLYIALEKSEAVIFKKPRKKITREVFEFLMRGATIKPIRALK